MYQGFWGRPIVKINVWYDNIVIHVNMGLEFWIFLCIYLFIYLHFQVQDRASRPPPNYAPDYNDEYICGMRIAAPHQTLWVLFFGVHFLVSNITYNN